VIVLHGGMGNAQRIAAAQSESGLNLNSLAEEDGFVVVYLHGTRVARRLGPDWLGWNAGGCCGLPAENNIDDVEYIPTRGADRRTTRVRVMPSYRMSSFRSA
jgi:polyhydroxybutyrate depolymerase